MCYSNNHKSTLKYKVQMSFLTELGGEMCGIK